MALKNTIYAYVSLFVLLLFTAILSNKIFNINSIYYVGGVVAVGFFIFLCSAELRKSYNQSGGKLARQFKKMGNLSGKPLEYFVEQVGNYKSHKDVVITDRNNAPGHFYVWYDKFYYIKLLFDDNEECICVSEGKFPMLNNK